ncbi:serine/threonine protein kinase [Roseibium sp.]|uniref:serine/threonine protein kinase n=1 Tax=Roseibium sp. TaxID=1936156 RepID=UPI003A97B104
MRPFIFLCFVIALLMPIGEEAEARIYCPLPEHGIWVNGQAKPKELSRLEIETKCVNDQVHARIRAFTKCSPRDCKWGWTKAELRDGGGLNVLLVGFLGVKNIDVRGFGDRLDAFVTDIKHDPQFPDTIQSYTLTRK